MDHDGPHAVYQGWEVCFNSNANLLTHDDEEALEIHDFLSIVDVTDKDAPEGLSLTAYASNYTSGLRVYDVTDVGATTPTSARRASSPLAASTAGCSS